MSYRYTNIRIYAVHNPYRPFDFVGRLSDEEPLGARLDLGASWVYRYLAVPSVLAFYLDGQQQQFQLREAQPVRLKHTRTSIRRIIFRFFTESVRVGGVDEFHVVGILCRLLLKKQK